MEDKMKVSYEQIKKANEEISKMQVGNGQYAKVSERVNAFRKVYPTGSIETEIEAITDTEVRIVAKVYDEDEKLISTARATEEKKAKGKMTINLTDMIENCETSAVGRALGFAGFGIDKEIASGEDIARNKYQNKQYEIHNNMFIPDEEAKNVVKVVIMDLMRKMGVVKVELEDKVNKKLWASLSELTTHQLLHIESILKEINVESNEWHDLYNKNLRIKEVVPKNQEVVYESSFYKFGKIALEQAGTNELLRNEIINSYLDFGVNLEK